MASTPAEALYGGISEGARNAQEAENEKARNQLMAYLQGIKGQQEQEQLKTKAGLEGAAGAENWKRVQEALQSGELPEGSGVNFSGTGGVSVTKGYNPLLGLKMQTSGAKDILGEQHKQLDKMETGMQMLQTAKAFLQNPNARNMQELKVLIPMAQGWPARAMGTEISNSGFSGGMWDHMLARFNDIANNPSASPITQEELNTWRGNTETLSNLASKRFDAQKDTFWKSSAPRLGKAMMPSDIEGMRKDYENKIQQSMGDYHNVPWRAGTQAATETPVRSIEGTTTPSPSTGGGIKKYLSGVWNAATGQQQQPAPAQSQLQQAVPPQTTPAVQTPMFDFDAEDKRRAASKVKQSAQQQMGQ